MYPTWEQLAEQNNPLTEGERALIKFLDEHLPRDPHWKEGQELEDYNGWLIFAQPFLNGTRPDVMVFHPRVGVMIYEVKDWNLAHYHSEGDDLYVSDGRGSYHRKHPVDQVDHYKLVLISQLVPAIGEAIDKNKKKFALIKTGLYFHNASTQRCQEVIGPRFKRPEHYPLFGRDHLRKEFLEEIVPHLPYTGGSSWERRWNEDVLFWLRPPFHSIEQGTLLRMKGNQMRVAEPLPGHHRVRGIAGSGKTQALACRAAKLASQGCDVLVVTFNITLWHYIKDMIARAPFNFDWGRITFTQFHGFCQAVLNERGIKWPKSPLAPNETAMEEALEDFFRTTVTDAVATAVRDAPHPGYDAILVDEGQDYHYEWYALLDQYFIRTRDEFVVVCDKRQNVFQRDLDWLDKRVTRIGLEKFKDPYIDLTITYRLPQKVAVMANDFSERFNMNQELKVSKIEDNPVLVHAHHIVWLNIEQADWKETVVQAYDRLKQEKYSASDMVFLLPDHPSGVEAVKLFESMGVQVNHVFNDPTNEAFKHKKKAFWMGDGRVKMSTIHSFKGWELLNVVLYIPPDAPRDPAQLDSLVYTAMTRTKENLIVLNASSRYRAFGEKLPKHWNEQ